MQDEGTDPDTLSSERHIDVRYHGQSFELGVAADDWVERFHRAHLERYGYERRQTPVEAVTLRVTVTAGAATLEHPALSRAEDEPPTGTAGVVFGGTRLEAALVRRGDLSAGHRVSGPAVICEYSSTTWVPPGCSADVDTWGCLHLTFDS